MYRAHSTTIGSASRSQLCRNKVNNTPTPLAWERWRAPRRMTFRRQARRTWWCIDGASSNSTFTVAEPVGSGAAVEVLAVATAAFGLRAPERRPRSLPLSRQTVGH
jgi:hypothetical protein